MSTDPHNPFASKGPGDDPTDQEYTEFGEDSGLGHFSFASSAADPSDEPFVPPPRIPDDDDDDGFEEGEATFIVPPQKEAEPELVVEAASDLEAKVETNGKGGIFQRGWDATLGRLFSGIANSVHQYRLRKNPFYDLEADLIAQDEDDGQRTVDIPAEDALDPEKTLNVSQATGAAGSRSFDPNDESDIRRALEPTMEQPYQQQPLADGPELTMKFADLEMGASASHGSSPKFSGNLNLRSPRTMLLGKIEYDKLHGLVLADDAYTLEEKIGEGGMGVVYRGYSAAEQHVAVKVIKEVTNDETVARFHREGVTLLKARSGNIVRTYAVGQKKMIVEAYRPSDFAENLNDLSYGEIADLGIFHDQQLEELRKYLDGDYVIDGFEVADIVDMDQIQAGRTGYELKDVEVDMPYLVMEVLAHELKDEDKIAPLVGKNPLGLDTVYTKPRLQKVLGKVWLPSREHWIDQQRTRAGLEYRVEEVRASTAGLRAAHEQGLVHRDLKLDNVMIGPSWTDPEKHEWDRRAPLDMGMYGVINSLGELIKILKAEDRKASKKEGHKHILEDPETFKRVKEYVEGMVHSYAKVKAHSKVGDFGLVKEKQKGVEDQGNPLGTPLYMAPEQWDEKLGEIDARTDVFQMGVLLYKVTTGNFPLQGPNINWFLFNASDRSVHNKVDEPYRLNPGMGQELSAIIQKAMSFDQKGRYEDAGELEDDLIAWQQNKPVEAVLEKKGRLGKVAYASKKWLHRNSLVFGLVTALGLTAGYLGFTTYSEGKERIQKRDAAVAQYVDLSDEASVSSLTQARDALIEVRGLNLSESDKSLVSGYAQELDKRIARAEIQEEYQTVRTRFEGQETPDELSDFDQVLNDLRAIESSNADLPENFAGARSALRQVAEYRTEVEGQRQELQTQIDQREETQRLATLRTEASGAFASLRTLHQEIEPLQEVTGPNLEAYVAELDTFLEQCQTHDAKLAQWSETGAADARSAYTTTERWEAQITAVRAQANTRNTNRNNALDLVNQANALFTQYEEATPRAEDGQRIRQAITLYNRAVVLDATTVPQGRIDALTRIDVREGQRRIDVAHRYVAAQFAELIALHFQRADGTYTGNETDFTAELARRRQTLTTRLTTPQDVRLRGWALDTQMRDGILQTYDANVTRAAQYASRVAANESNTSRTERRGRFEALTRDLQAIERWHDQHPHEETEYHRRVSEAYRTRGFPQPSQSHSND